MMRPSRREWYNLSSNVSRLQDSVMPQDSADPAVHSNVTLYGFIIVNNLFNTI